MTPIKVIREEFELRWVRIFRAYEPLLRNDELSLVSLTSAIKGLAWNCYLQGRTDELSRERNVGRRLVSAKITALLKKSEHAPRG